jgi:ureidoglycolate hydrolase
MIDEKLLEVCSYTGEGFRPLVYFNSWRVAVLNYIDELEPANIHRVERHPQTDEVFVLLRGQGTLFVGAGEPEMETFYAQGMELGVVYNVKPHTWHAVVLSREASVLIVENADTGEHNSQFCELHPEQRQFILEIALGNWTKDQALQG